MQTEEVISFRRSLRIALVCMSGILSVAANAGIPEEYGKRIMNRYEVQFKVDHRDYECSSNEISLFGQDGDCTTVKYYDDGTVKWEIGGCNILGIDFVVKGTRIDESGSFKVKADDRIGEYCYDAELNSMLVIFEISPMMQYEGRPILLKHWKDLIFRVTPDNTIKWECSRKDLPSGAEACFGIMEMCFSEKGSTDIDGYLVEYRRASRVGPYWMMVHDFCMTPEQPGSVEGIADDSPAAGAPVYDILGNRVKPDNLSPGVYICKGKKYIVK